MKPSRRLGGPQAVLHRGTMAAKMSETISLFLQGQLVGSCAVQIWSSVLSLSS